MAAETRDKLKREHDSGDLLLILASASATRVARIPRELGVDLDLLPGVVERIRTQALATTELTRHVQRDVDWLGRR